MKGSGLPEMLELEIGKALETAWALFQPGSLDRIWHLPGIPPDPALLMDRALSLILGSASSPMPAPDGFRSRTALAPFPGDRNDLSPLPSLLQESGRPSRTHLNSADTAPVTSLTFPGFPPHADRARKTGGSLSDPAIPFSRTASPSSSLPDKPGLRVPMDSRDADSADSLPRQMVVSPSRSVREQDRSLESLPLPGSSAVTFPEPSTNFASNFPSETLEGTVLRSRWERTRYEAGGGNVGGPTSNAGRLLAALDAAHAPVESARHPAASLPVRGAFSSGALSALLQGQVEASAPGETALPAGHESGTGTFTRIFQAGPQAPTPPSVPPSDFAFLPEGVIPPDEDAWVDRVLDRLDSRAREESIRRYGVSGGLA